MLTMYGFIEDTLGSILPDMSRVASSLAKSKLFTMHEIPPLLLSIAQQARHDIQVDIAYLYTRVRNKLKTMI